MKKRIGILVLVILIGAWLVFPVSGWAWIGVWRPIHMVYQQDQTEQIKWRDYTGHTPWADDVAHSTQSEQSEEGMIVGPKVIVPSGFGVGTPVSTKQHKSKKN